MKSVISAVAVVAILVGGLFFFYNRPQQYIPGLYENHTIGVSFSYPKDFALREEGHYLIAPKFLNEITTQTLRDGKSGEPYVTIYDKPIGFGSMGTETEIHQERTANGKIVRMYYEVTKNSETPLSIGIGWTSADKPDDMSAYIYLTPATLPDNLKNLPEDIFSTIELR